MPVSQLTVSMTHSSVSYSAHPAPTKQSSHPRSDTSKQIGSKARSKDTRRVEESTERRIHAAVFCFSAIERERGQKESNEPKLDQEVVATISDMIWYNLVQLKLICNFILKAD